MKNIEEKLNEYGRERDCKNLQNFIENINDDELSNFVKLKLSNPSFLNYWNYILNGFNDSSTSHKKRFKLVQDVLKELQTNEISTTQCNAIVHRLCIELDKLKSKHLIELCNFCLGCIQSNHVTQMCWKDLLPEILNVIVERDFVEFNDEEITGIEYKHQLINSICMLQLSPNIVTSIAAMFIDITLTKEEHLQIINKLGQYIDKLTPQELPSFIYQLLRLSNKANSRSIFLKLQNYFGCKVYENATFESNSETPIFDIIESTDNDDLIDAESTILYHIHTSASLDHESIKDYLLSLKNMLKSPEFILHPFQLNVLFTISTINHYEERVFEIIRLSITRNYSEKQKCKHSSWCRDMIPVFCDIEQIFSQIINFSSQNRDLVIQGLVNFAFVLLNVGSALGRDPIAEKQWRSGTLILYKIIKRKRHIAPIILQNLCNHIVTGHNITQYIECLYMLCKNLQLLMLENRNIIIKLMDDLVQMPANNANQLLDCLIVLTKVSPTIRDHLILLLRKALYLKIIETRQMAVNGYLKLLTMIKISNLTPLSQTSFNGSFSSGHSLFTQISVNRIVTSTQNSSIYSNEALCLEILSILKRCFLQQLDVRYEFYSGLYQAFCSNPDLGVPILDVLWSHFENYYETDEETLPPLKFDKITITKDISVTLQEPLGMLIFTIGLITTKIVRIDNDSSTEIVDKCVKILESLCKRMINCELVHFTLDDGTDLLDITPEAQQKFYILKESMNIYEALIGYKIFTFQQNENNCQQINSLFQGFSRLKHTSKNLSKAKKSDKKKKIDTSTQSDNSTTTTTITTLKKVPKNRNDTTILDFQVVIKALNLLYGPNVKNTENLRTKKEFHQYIINATLSLVNHLKHKKMIEIEHSKLIHGYLCDISIILYQQIIKTLKTFIEFDCTTSILVVECFLIILNLISNQFQANFKSFLCKILDKNKDVNISDNLLELFQVYQKLFEIDDDDVGEDADIKKLTPIVINTLHFIVNQVPIDSSSVNTQGYILEWLKTISVNKTIKNKTIVNGFMNLFFDAHIKFKISLTLFENVAIQLSKVTGEIIEEDNSDIEEFKIITKLTTPNIFICLCNHLKTILEDVDWMIARLRAEYNMITYPGEERTERKRELLKSKERGVCCQLCFLVTILTNLCNCCIPAGNLSEAVLKDLSLLYNILGSLTKYFVMRSSKINPAFQAARFERLVRLTGKQLSPIVYKLITYIEDSQKQEAVSQQNNKKRHVDTAVLKSKVLKETRLIPKVVYEIEQFSKFVIQLSKKMKIDLSKFVGSGTVRDFRIFNLKEVLEQAENLPPITQSTPSDSSALDDSNQQTDEESPPIKKVKQ